MRHHHRRAGGRNSRLRACLLALSVGALALLALAAPAGAQDQGPEIPAEAPDAVEPLDDLSATQERQLARALRGLVGTIDVGELPKIDLPSPDAPSLPNLPAAGALGSPDPVPSVRLAAPGQDLIDDLLGLLDAAQFQWVTEYGQAGMPPVRRTHFGLPILPTPLDVGGDPLPDVLAQLTPTANGAEITITRLALPLLSPAKLPLKIEAVVKNPASPATDGAAFGYDARSDTAPANFNAALGVTNSGGSQQVGVTVNTNAPGRDLTLLGEAFKRGPGGARLDPLRLRMGMTPVPSTARLRAALGGGGNATVELGASRPTLVDLSGEDLTGDGERRLDARIDRLPSSLSIGVTEDVSGAHVDYRASAPVNGLTAGLRDTAAGGGIEQDAALELTGVPTEIDVDQTGAAGASVTASDSIGSALVGLATGGEVRRLSDPAYVHTFRDATVDSLAAKVLGLRSATLDGGDPLLLDATLAPGPFRALLVDGNRTVDAHVNDLPGQVHLGFSPSAGTAEYTGSAPVEEITAVATDPDGLSGRATELDLVLQDIPTELDATIGGSAGQAFGLDASPGALGFVRAQLSSGPDESLPAGADDGLVLRDLDDRYVALAQVSGLRSVSVAQQPTIDLTVETVGGRIFGVDLRQRTAGAGSPVQTIAGRIDRLPSHVRARFLEQGGARRLLYEASDNVGLVTLSADNLPVSGRARRAELRLEGVPTSLVLDLGADGGPIDLNTGGAELGRVEALLTSGPTETVPAGFDGLVAKDIASHYALAARITGLRRVTANQSPLALHLELANPRPFKARLDQQALTGGKVTFTDATLDQLQRVTDLSLNESGGVQRVNYSADATASSLALATNAGDRRQMTASVAPVPTALALCFAGSSNVCGNTTRPGGEGSLRLTASQQATVNMFDCKQDNNANCSSPEKQLRVTNLSLRRLELNLETGQNCSFLGCLPEGSRGSIWLDTDNLNLSGQAFTDDGGAAEITARFPAGFRANDRFVSWSNFIPGTKTGSITCPSGTALDVELFDAITVNVAGLYLC